MLVHALLTHQRPAAVAAMQKWWEEQAGVPAEAQVILHGGEAVDFAAVPHAAKIFCGDDPRLRTRDHQRDKQGYGGVLTRLRCWLAEHRPDWTHVHLAEYDQIPLRRDFGDLLLRALSAESADLLGYRVLRVDGTSHPHFLYHCTDPRFLPYFAQLSVRPQKQVILSMFGSGSLWTREAFEAVAAQVEPFPIYLEIALPSLAHHLGFRVRRFPAEAEAWIENLGNRIGEIDQARAAGGWSIHPVKTMW